MADQLSGITREHVRWAYRTFLDREPESEEAISAHMDVIDLGVLARRFITSQEFRQRQSLPPPQLRLVPLDVKPNPVELEVDANTLSSLIAHVRRCWELLGQECPHHSVLTNPAFRPEALPENEVAFWASGEHEAAVLLRILARHGMASVSNLTCIDFGCGVGRVTAPLADRFTAVHAYDISGPHIEIARTRSSKPVFHLVRELPVRLVSTDVFHSRIVLQHNPPPIIAMLVKSALASLKPNGIAVFQVPTYEMGYSFEIRSYLDRISGAALDMEMHCLPQQCVFNIVAAAGCRLLEVREDDSTASLGRIISNTFVVQRPSAPSST